MRRRGDARAAGRLLTIALAAGLLAGGCAHYVPALPMRARSGDAELQFRHMRTGFRREIVLQSTTTVPHTIRDGWLTVPTRDPCSGGAEATGIFVDGQPASMASVFPGSHTIAVRYDDDLADYSLDTVLDLLLDDGACWRTPIISQSIGLEATGSWSLTTGVGITGNTDVRGLRAVVDVRAGVARWLGPFQLAVHFGFGESLCNEGTCGRLPDGKGLRYGQSFGFGLEARWAAIAGRVNRLENVGLLGVRYSATSVAVPAFDGDRRWAVHGLHGLLVWAYGEAIRGPVRRTERAAPIELVFPIGVVVDPSGPRRVAFSAGLDVRFAFNL